ncbi:MAG: 4-hydroxyphenyl-beta-ketoacyl-CoA hydrolase [Burkholderiales bacterium]|jgi:predicted TIM-barrel fold metal-dependent hydrolase|nr:MAG: 4-hydroxyphenyl-beta-ketoacyl-CoA hydrolase [Burkholderiales bacterium]
MNIDELVAIDIHTHAETSTRMLPDEAEAEALEARGRYFRYEVKHPTIAQMADYYRQRRIGFVVFTVDHERGMGIKRISNEEVAESAAEHADICIPFASIDPGRGKMGVREARRLIEHFGVKGFKFHPIIQGFRPNDRDVYPLYEVIAEAGLPALFHTGQTGIGAGMRGGGGLRIKYGDPILLDDVAADFPDLQIVMAHPAVPWQDEQLSVALHKPNTWIDLSGWSPKYFEPKLVQYANTLLKDRVLFGTDNPVILPDRWIADFEKLPIKPEVRPLIMKENAVRLLKLA